MKADVQPYRIEIESLDLEGRGVGRRDGKAIFVEGALPGEQVMAAPVKIKASFEVARLVDVIRPSAGRVVPRCAHFGLERGSCGGCAMQHLDARFQVAIKQRVLEDALWHVGRVRAEQILRPVHGPAWHYRFKARMTVRRVEKKGGVLVGFHERGSSYVADMRECHVLPVEVAGLLMPLRELVAGLSIAARLPQIEVAAAVQDGRLRMILVFRVLQPPTPDDHAAFLRFGQQHGADIWLQPAGPDTAAPLIPSMGNPLQMHLPESDVRLPFGPTDFTQVNHSINRVLVERAMRLLQLRPEDRVADFFCGLGNFTLPLGTRAAAAIGIEGSEALVRRARQAAQANGLSDRVSFEARNLFEWTPSDWIMLNRSAGPIDAVLIDPPREGAQAVVQALAQAEHRPRRLVYVSCNPATLARDSSVLVHEGGWALKAAGVVNMFPHTAHVESMAVFEPGPASVGEGNARVNISG